MAILASDIMAMVRGALLNDLSGAIYPDAAVYPVMNLAYRQLQTRLSSMGLSMTKEIFAVVTVPAGTVFLGDGALLPSDLLMPRTLKEKASGAADSTYIDMDELDWEPNITIGNELRYWVWREEQIKFPGSLLDRQVLIQGIKSLGSISGANSPILILNCEPWLAQRTASMAALTIGSDKSRAKALNDDLTEIWDDFKIGLTKRTQAIPVRRRRTRYRQD